MDNFQKVELLKLTTEQQSDLDEMLQTLKPNYILTTYLIDPINTNLCYIFIENTKSNEIKNYTIVLNNKQSLIFVKNRILEDGTPINDLFYLNFKNILNIQYEIENLKIFSLSYNLVIYNKFINLIINNFSILIVKLDASFINKVNFNNVFFTISMKIADLICQNLNEFLKIGYKLQSTKKFNRCLLLNNFKNYKIMEDYISHITSGSENFFSLDLHLKFDYINRLTDCMYYFCLKNNILLNFLIEYVLSNINSISNKLDKYTFILCFVAIYKYESNYQSEILLLKLIIITHFYLQNPNYDTNNKESLILLHMISKKRVYKYEKINTLFEICILDEKQEDNLKIIIIRRYYVFFLHCYNKNLRFLKKLETNEKYFDFIWLIIKCCIYTIYNVLDINLI
ncbi:hypothetical protein NAPIS_ORF01567 [Vairimorpha apis BRL 01]|uniref:Uncharacterized protein n=1 Tax=Vairimorpha apis BRL 01 TaxID=1037528 RepID=T0MCH5_9MICR|nr:hypothetical protein NAPIS_ORF01567 [Vairimorpha apis BRL 01]